MRLRRKSHGVVKQTGLSLGLAVGLGAGLGAAFVAAVAEADPPAALDGFERFVEADGDFVFDPATAMQGLVHLGSYFVPMGDAAGFHHVYTQPGVPDAWRREGAFPDGTVLVKEVATHRTADYTTGQGVASATGARQWFVMIKDGRNRFPDHPLWGQGWGWALYKSDAPTTNVARDYRLDCLGCHAPARPSDWVYVDGYPALRALRDAAEKSDPKSEEQK